MYIIIIIYNIQTSQIPVLANKLLLYKKVTIKYINLRSSTYVYYNNIINVIFNKTNNNV